MTDTAFPTLDALFRRILAQAPDRPALCDPPDKARVTGAAPRRLTYAEADRAIAALAAHFVEARLPPGAVIGLQLPNTVEAVLTLLAATRAGLVAAMLPQLWRQADLAAALNRVNARAIVTCGTVDGVDHGALAMTAAAETFSIRHVCGFGPDLPDGMVALDEVAANAPAAAPDCCGDARHAVVVTFDVTAAGLVTVPRSHAALIAGALKLHLDGRLPRQAAIVAAATPSSFGTLAASVAEWLVSGGMLALHHPFAPDVLLRQLSETPCDVLVAPAVLALALAGDLSRYATLSHVVGLWRAPEQIAASAAWQGTASFIDVALFGETGLAVTRRGAERLPAPLPDAGDVRLTARGTLALGGAMVPASAYRGDPSPPDDTASADIDTGYAARRITGGGLVVTAPPPGLVAVGGYRFRASELETWGRMLPADVTLAAVPARLTGYRLAGHAADRVRTRKALIELGLNPLVAEAFR